MRNVDGFTPLHVAVQQGFPGMVSLLLLHSPDLHVENGVGNTPLEMAAVKHLQVSMQQHKARNSPTSDTLSGYLSTSIERITPATLSKELPKLRATLTALTQEGKIEGDSLLAKSVEEFADFMESKLAATRSANVVSVDEKYRQDTCDVSAVYRILSDSTSRREPRLLVHLIDVQRSVQGSLDKFVAEKQDYTHHNDDGLEPEVDDERRERDGSFIVRAVGWVLDKY